MSAVAEWKMQLNTARLDPALLPTVVKADLDEAVFTRFAAWAGDEELYAEDEGVTSVISCQMSPSGGSAGPGERAVYLLLKELPASDSGVANLTLRKRPKPADRPVDRVYNPWRELPGVYLDHQEENSRVVVSIEGKLFTRYLYSPSVAKPYFHPLIGPRGKSLIQDAPDDHLHHHGLWWGHDDVNGHRLYHEFRGEGRQIQREFTELASGPVFGQITARIDWVAEDGHLLLQETRSARIYNLPPESRYMDLSSELRAADGDVRFGDTKEGGFPFVRVNEQINAHQTGVITAASGKRGEAGIFGTVTEWVDYSGRINCGVQREEGWISQRYVEAGIAMFAHPANESWASQWFVRDYGPFTSANFHFCGGKTLKTGEILSVKHRLYIHQGDAAVGKVSERYREYAIQSDVSCRLREI